MSSLWLNRSPWDHTGALENIQEPLRPYRGHWDQIGTPEIGKEPLRPDMNCWDQIRTAVTRYELLRPNMNHWDQISSTETRYESRRQVMSPWDHIEATETSYESLRSNRNYGNQKHQSGQYQKFWSSLRDINLAFGTLILPQEWLPGLTGTYLTSWTLILSQ